MAGSATLDPNVLIDQLVSDVIDPLRDSLHPLFGVRAYRIHTILRTWSGPSRGQGTFSDVLTELTPQPLVEEWNGVHWDLQDCGVDELGEIRLREVSLTYTEAELIGPRPMGANQQWFIRLTDAHGQASRERFFLHNRPPYVDRIKDMGWVMWLRSAKA